MTIEDPPAVEQALAGLSREVHQELSATAERVRRLRRMISAATAVPIVILLAWPVMVPSLLSLLVRMGRLAASPELRGPLRWAAGLPARDRAQPEAGGAVADLVVLGQAPLVVWSCVLLPPVVAAAMGAVLWWVF